MPSRGSASFDPNGVPPELAGAASAFVAVKFDREGSGDSRFTVLPNVQVISIHQQEGAVVPTAQFSYILSDDPTGAYPTAIGDLWPLAAQGPYVAQSDDELLIWEYISDGSRLLVFDGFVQIPQVDGGGGFAVTFVAEGVGIRLRDTPIGGAVYRDSDLATSGDPAVQVATHLPTWFNPTMKGLGRPNATPTGHDVNQGQPDAYPVFLDATLKGSPAPQAEWTLPMMVRYLCQIHNPDETWVNNPVGPAGQAIDDFLVAVSPKSGEYFDLSDPSTYDAKPIPVRSFDATGMSMLDAIATQLHRHGFEIAFNLREEQDGSPINELIVYRKDGLDGAEPVELWHPPSGGDISDGLPDFHAFGLVRDQHDGFNEVEIETDPVEYECSVILAPMFAIAGSDATNISLYDRAKLADPSTTEETRRKYRIYGFDETGEGHWDYATSATVNTVASLDSVLGAPDMSDGGERRRYAVRPRPGSPTLLSCDNKGIPRKAVLEISTDYAGTTVGKCPAVSDGTGTWRTLGDSGWNPLKDRLGIEIIEDNPEKWRLPKAPGSVAAAGDLIRGITAQAAPTAQTPRFFLRFTTVISADEMISAVAAKRDASPMKHKVRRRIDAKDHFKHQIVKKNTPYNTTANDLSYDPAATPPPPPSPRNDTAKAQAHADQMRAAREMPLLAGSITVPWVAHSVGIGDLVSKINGWNIDLAMNAGGPAGESPFYPVVVGFSWNCQLPQSTTYKLSDRRSEVERA